MEASTKIHYDVLQISHTASSAEIKAAYRSLIIGYHPDKALIQNNPTCQDMLLSDGLASIDIDDDDEENDGISNEETETLTASEMSPIKPTAQENETATENTIKFHQIQAAYHCLRDHIKRQQYDDSIRRKDEQKEWKWKGAMEVNLSEMDCDFCRVVDEEDFDSDQEQDSHIGAPSHDGDEPLQKVFFHPCRCGDTFQVFQEELLESIEDNKAPMISKDCMFTNRVWQCESCSLTIRIHVDIHVD